MTTKTRLDWRDSVTDTRSVVDQILVDCPDMVLREVSIGSWPLYVLEGDRARCDIYSLGDLGWNLNFYRKVDKMVAMSF